MRKLGILLAVLLFGVFVYAQKVDIEGILDRLELLEEYANMIYETVGTKVSYDDIEALIAELEERLASLETLLEDLRVTLDIHDSDILKIYETLGSLSEEVAGLRETISGLVAYAEDIEAMKLKLDMHDQDIVNIYDNLSMKANLETVENLESSVTALEETVNELSKILTGLAARISDTDHLLRKQIENLNKNLESKASKTDVEALMSRLELLEEYANMMYDLVNTKLSVEEFDAFAEELESRLTEIEVAILNIQSTLETGLPVLRDMLYELSVNLASAEERATMYTDLRVDSLKDEMIGEIATLKHDLTALKKDTTEKDDALEAKIKATNELAEQAKALAIVGILAGVLGIVLPFLIK